MHTSCSPLLTHSYFTVLFYFQPERRAVSAAAAAASAVGAAQAGAALCFLLHRSCGSCSSRSCHLVVLNSRCVLRALAGGVARPAAAVGPETQSDEQQLPGCPLIQRRNSTQHHQPTTATTTERGV